MVQPPRRRAPRKGACPVSEAARSCLRTLLTGFDESGARAGRQAVEDAMNAGIERFGLNDREAVRRSMRDLRLEPALAREVLSTAARKAFQARPRAGIRVG